MKKTKSFFNTTKMECNIDFDAASKAWMHNKRKMNNGCYEYRCLATTTKGQPCKCKPNSNSNYCRYHILNENPILS